MDTDEKPQFDDEELEDGKDFSFTQFGCAASASLPDRRCFVRHCLSPVSEVCISYVIRTLELGYLHRRGWGRPW